MLSIVIPTKNSGKNLEELLPSLRKQSYQDLEIIVSDGKSDDKTLELAKKYDCTILHNTKILAEPGVSLGMKHAKCDLVMVLATDNIYTDRDALKKMVSVFDDKSIVAAFPKHESKSQYTLFSQYINTFTDPFNHFLYRNAANARTFHKVYKTVQHTEIYDVYDFNSCDVKPILAFAQGFTIRKKFIEKDRNEMDDIQPVLKMIETGKKIAYVHSVELFHDTVRSQDHFIRKIKWATKNALQSQKYGIAERRDTLTSAQKTRVYLFPVYSFSVILPFLRSIYGLIQDRHIIWLFHPYITFVTAFAIVSETLAIKMGHKKEISRL